jgi:hypothetical protein
METMKETLRKDGATYIDCLADGGSDEIRFDESKHYTAAVLYIYDRVKLFVSRFIPLKSNDEFALLQGHVFYAMTAFALRFFLMTYSYHITSYPTIPKEYTLPSKFDGLSSTEVDENKELLLELVQQWDTDIKDFFFLLPQNETEEERHFAYNTRLLKFQQVCINHALMFKSEKFLSANVVHIMVELIKKCIDHVNKYIVSDVIRESKRLMPVYSETCMKCLKTSKTS